MADLSLSDHAQSRMICAEALDLVLSYGRQVHDHHGGVICFLDGKARRRVRQAVAPELERLLERAGGTYVVLSRDGNVVTVGHRTARIKRDLRPPPGGVARAAISGRDRHRPA